MSRPARRAKRRLSSARKPRPAAARSAPARPAAKRRRAATAARGAPAAGSTRRPAASGKPRARSAPTGGKATAAATPAASRRTASAGLRAPGAVVGTDWLAARLGHARLRVVDGSWHMPQLNRNARAEYAAAHLPGAVFFDIDAIADRQTTLPHMLPTARQFAEQVGALGIGPGNLVVVYDSRGVVSAARVWWTLRAMGHERVSVLDGGLPKWRAEGRPLESGEPVVRRRRFAARPRPALVRTLEQMRDNVETAREQVLDARSRGRFAGTEPEPRAGLRGGHIPGSLNLPYDALYRPDGTLLPAEELRRRFEASGLDLDEPVATTCGSGVTASVLALGLHVVGHRRVAVYDGSWSEWGAHADTPVEP